MAFTYAPDFIIKRKRKRSHVVYDSSDDEQDVKSCDESQIAGPSTSRAIPTRGQPTAPGTRIQPESKARASEDISVRQSQHTENVVTVEDFLQWSVKAPTAPAKRRGYGRTKRTLTYVNLQRSTSIDNENSSLHSDVDVATGGPSQDAPHPSAQVDSLPTEKPGHRGKQRPRKKQALAQRLLQAAVLSYVDPAGLASGQEPSGAHTPRAVPIPIRFERVPSTAPPADARKPKPKWRLADPRTVDPFRNLHIAFPDCARASGSTTPGPLLAPKKCRRISDWQARLQFQVVKRPSGDTCPPPRRKPRRNHKEEEDTPDACPERIGVNPIPFVRVSPQEAMRMWEERQRLLDEMNGQNRTPRLKMVKVQQPAAVSTPSHEAGTTDDVPHVSSQMQPYHKDHIDLRRPRCSEFPDPGRDEFSSPVAISSPVPLPDTSDTETPQLFSVMGKPLKPLTSYMDMFYETARKVAIAEAEAKAKAERRSAQTLKPRKSLRSKGSGRSASLKSPDIKSPARPSSKANEGRQHPGKRSRPQVAAGRAHGSEHASLLQLPKLSVPQNAQHAECSKSRRSSTGAGASPREASVEAEVARDRTVDLFGWTTLRQD
ncbi:hypothetical protein WOLCODRAFT_137951 [Wolfiporia cocos MD-104 SS10]|uniref:Uncharacterized protein n=1 Tax=Wolfiporia cocos (strain MD-104) TaxID=742152 RepID=A0A2H3JK08_WOLCO|nr:hypothetical protein WOLCODRAFT_137951 [Wolfiporia cocos MD-104 SS10]